MFRTAIEPGFVIYNYLMFDGIVLGRNSFLLVWWGKVLHVTNTSIFKKLYFSMPSFWQIFFSYSIRIEEKWNEKNICIYNICFKILYLDHYVLWPIEEIKRELKCLL